MRTWSSACSPASRDHAEADDAVRVILTHDADDEDSRAGRHTDGRAKCGRHTFGRVRLRECVGGIRGRPGGFAEQPVDRDGVGCGAGAQHRRRHILGGEGHRVREAPADGSQKKNSAADIQHVGRVPFWTAL